MYIWHVPLHWPDLPVGHFSIQENPMLDILMSGAGHVGHLQVKRMQCSPFSF